MDNLVDSILVPPLCSGVGKTFCDISCQKCYCCTENDTVSEPLLPNFNGLELGEFLYSNNAILIYIHVSPYIYKYLFHNMYMQLHDSISWYSCV